MHLGDLPLPPDEAGQGRLEVAPGGQRLRCCRGVHAARQQIPVEPTGLRVGVGAVGLSQVAAQPFIKSQRLRPPALLRQQPHVHPGSRLVQRVSVDGAPQRFERRADAAHPGTLGGVGDRQVTERLAQVVPRPARPILESILGQEFPGVRIDRRGKVIHRAGGPRASGQLTEASYIRLDRAVGVQ